MTSTAPWAGLRHVVRDIGISQLRRKQVCQRTVCISLAHQRTLCTGVRLKIRPRQSKLPSRALCVTSVPEVSALQTSQAGSFFGVRELVKALDNPRFIPISYLMLCGKGVTKIGLDKVEKPVLMNLMRRLSSQPKVFASRQQQGELKVLLEELFDYASAHVGAWDKNSLLEILSSGSRYANTAKMLAAVMSHYGDKLLDSVEEDFSRLAGALAPVIERNVGDSVCQDASHLFRRVCLAFKDSLHRLQHTDIILFLQHSAGERALEKSFLLECEKHITLSSLLDDDFSNLCRSLAALKYSPQKLEFVEELENRVDHLSLPLLCVCFSFVAHHCTLPSPAASRFCDLFSARIEDCTMLDLRLVAAALGVEQLRKKSFSVELGKAIANVVSLKADVLNIHDSASFVHSLSALGVCSQKLGKKLCKHALFGANELTPSAVCHVLAGVITHLGDGIDSVVRAVRFASRVSCIQAEDLSLVQAITLSSGLANMRLHATPRWLAAVGMFAKTYIERNGVVGNASGLAIILTSLATLRFRSHRLIDVLNVALQKEELVHSSLVQYVWCCILWDIQPHQAFTTFSRLPREGLAVFDKVDRLRLLQINAIIPAQYRLPVKTFRHLRQLLEEKDEMTLIRGKVAQYVKDIRDVLGSENVGPKLVNVNGSVVPASVLVHSSGHVVKWSKSHSLSVQKLQLLSLKCIALLPLGPAFWGFESSQLLGTGQMQVYALEAAGWLAVPIPWQIWAKCADKKKYLMELIVKVLDDDKKTKDQKLTAVQSEVTVS